MRCSGWSSLAISACSAAALVLASPAGAHVVATPTFLPSGSAESIVFAGPNERDAPMTSFTLTVPEGVAIVHAHQVEGWDESTSGSTATWTGGSLAPDEEVDFGATLEADVEPSIVQIQANQRYDDGSVVSWPVALTITPAEESPSENLGLAAVVGVIGVLLVAAVGMLAWRRRG